MKERYITCLNVVAVIAWFTACAVVAARMILLHHRETVFAVYRLAGWHWLQGQPLYSDLRGFLYSPLVAAFFAPLAWLPATAGGLLWLALDLSVFISGLVAVLRTDLFPKLRPRYLGLILLLLLPMVVSNIDIAQANPLIAGLLLLTIAAARRERWNLAAVAVVVAGYFKIYPIIPGLLLLLVAPKRLSWRLAIALIFFGLLPFLFQHWNYVGNQYRDWFTARALDDPLEYSTPHAKIDLWLLLVRMGGLHLAPSTYRWLQASTGFAIALYCFVNLRRGWPRRRILVALFCLAGIWMTLCGPATEGVTYLILAPAVVLSLVEVFLEKESTPIRAGMACAYALLFLTVIKNSLAPHLGSWTRAMQPAAAIVFLFSCLIWLPRSSREQFEPRNVEDDSRKS